jgi:hypothetical protein
MPEGMGGMLVIFGLLVTVYAQRLDFLAILSHNKDDTNGLRSTLSTAESEEEESIPWLTDSSGKIYTRSASGNNISYRPFYSKLGESLLPSAPTISTNVANLNITQDEDDNDRGGRFTHSDEQVTSHSPLTGEEQRLISPSV